MGAHIILRTTTWRSSGGKSIWQIPELHQANARMPVRKKIVAIPSNNSLMCQSYCVYPIGCVYECIMNYAVVTHRLNHTLDTPVASTHSAGSLWSHHVCVVTGNSSKQIFLETDNRHQNDKISNEFRRQRRTITHNTNINMFCSVTSVRWQ